MKPKIMAQLVALVTLCKMKPHLDNLPANLRDSVRMDVSMAEKEVDATVRSVKGWGLGDKVEDVTGKAYFVDGFFVPDAFSHVNVALCHVKADGTRGKRTEWHSLDANLTLVS